MQPSTATRAGTAAPAPAAVALPSRYTTTDCYGEPGIVVEAAAFFDGSQPDDGLLEVGVVTARSRLEWIRTLARVVVGSTERSPFAVMARGTSIKVTFDTPTAYELDGGVRKAVTTMVNASFISG